MPSFGKQLDVNRRVCVRSRDDLATLQDLPSGATGLARAFPLTPQFDALSYFRLVTSIGAHNRVDAYVTDVQPLRFSASVAQADVVVTSLRNYYPKFADDSDPSGHIHLTLKALPTLTNGNRSDLYLSDVVIDSTTMLPLRVTHQGHDDRTFTVDYGFTSGQWVITHVFFEQTMYAPLRIGRVHYRSDAYFDGYDFPTAAPDPRLR